ncbi:MAG: hypothetical protein DCC49_10600 [Acidobacteria bacterium]|nr:MAG: hypothetical protein DCC49_10600 [Acidobacteriota bacterium]
MSASAEELWSWERVYWHTHCSNCLANCPSHLYVKGNDAIFQEPSGDLPEIEGVPDMNPLGCNKGAVWHTQITGGDRVLYPMKRVGERGSGQWERISWDEALNAVADAIIDAHEEEGAHSVMIDEGNECGTVTMAGRSRLTSAINAVALDGTGSVSDVHQGHCLTFGNATGGSGADDTFHSDVILVWNANPAYTRIPYYHYLAEARYRGATVVMIAPDYNPSTMHCDFHVPVTPGTDAALGLAMCKVIIDEDLGDWNFAKSQTDLALLVKADGKFLRNSDLDPSGRTDRFYVIEDGQIAPANAGKLDDPSAESAVELDASVEVELADGSSTEVRTVFSILKERLEDYTLERAAEVCGVHQSIIEKLARLVASGSTRLYNGLGSCKHYHGDLMERAMNLVLGLTGNWGKPGAGLDTYTIGLIDGEILGMLKGQAGGSAEMAFQGLNAMLDAMKAADPEMSDSQAAGTMMRRSATFGTTTPAAFFLYYHCGFDEIWDREGWGDNPRPMSEYINEAMTRGWWGGLAKPGPETEPKVLIQQGTNTLRRTRGGQREMLETVWKKLDMIVLIDFRMNTAGMFGDIILPAAVEGERIELHAPNSHAFERTFSDRALEPLGEARSDWQIFHDITEAISRRAAERGIESFSDSRGGQIKYAEIFPSFTANGAVTNEEDALAELIADSHAGGNIDPDLSMERLREIGWFQPLRLPRAIAAATGGQYEPGKPFVAYRDQVEKGTPFATLTGRAQFYIDHAWFLEAGEELPVHKAPPRAGGDHPFVITGGHPRWSIHAINTTNRIILETTRGYPTVLLAPVDATAKGVEENDWVRIFNDLGSLSVRTKISPSVSPGQVVLYASWEQYLYPEWKDATAIEPGLVKWLHFAGGYGHLGYASLQWQPTQSDRLFRVDFERIDPLGADERATGAK